MSSVLPEQKPRVSTARNTVGIVVLAIILVLVCYYDLKSGCLCVDDKPTETVDPPLPHVEKAVPAPPSAPAHKAKVGPEPAPLAKPSTAERYKALVEACRRGDHQRVKGLLTAGGDADARDKRGAPLLLVAAGRGHHRTARVLLDAGASVHVVDGSMGVSAMHRAAQAGSVEILELLLARGAYIDQQSAVSGHTPLLDACFYKRYKAIDFLLRRGATWRCATP